MFAAGAESITLTREDWNAIQEISNGHFVDGLDVGRAQRETERIKREYRDRCGARARRSRHRCEAQWKGDTSRSRR